MNAILFNKTHSVSSNDVNEVFRKAEEIIKENSPKKSKKWLIITICIIVFLFILLSLSTIFALMKLLILD